MSLKNKDSITEPEYETKTVRHISCPLCDGEMVRRVGKYGEFYGCSNYKSNGCTMNMQSGVGRIIVPPKCKKHNVYMRYIRGEYGAFFGCPKWNENKNGNKCITVKYDEWLKDDRSYPYIEEQITKVKKRKRTKKRALKKYSPIVVDTNIDEVLKIIYKSINEDYESYIRNSEHVRKILGNMSSDESKGLSEMTEHEKRMYKIMMRHAGCKPGEIVLNPDTIKEWNMKEIMGIADGREVFTIDLGTRSNYRMKRYIKIIKDLLADIGEVITYRKGWSTKIPKRNPKPMGADEWEDIIYIDYQEGIRVVFTLDNI